MLSGYGLHVAQWTTALTVSVRYMVSGLCVAQWTTASMTYVSYAFWVGPMARMSPSELLL